MDMQQVKCPVNRTGSSEHSSICPETPLSSHDLIRMEADYAAHKYVILAI
jgi:hypothetical protein